MKVITFKPVVDKFLSTKNNVEISPSVVDETGNRYIINSQQTFYPKGIPFQYRCG